MKRISSLAVLLSLIISLCPPGVLAAKQSDNVKILKTSSDIFSGYYVTYEFRGNTYRSDELGSTMNLNLWRHLSNDDKRKVTRTFAFSPSDRNAQFGDAGSAELVQYVNDNDGWTMAGRLLRDRLAKKDFPALTEYYKKSGPPVSQSMRDAIAGASSEPEVVALAQKLRDIDAYFAIGQESYKALIAQNQKILAVNVTGLSEGIISLINDKILVPAITPATVSGISSDVAGIVAEYIDKITGATDRLYDAVGLATDDKSMDKIIKHAEYVMQCEEETATDCILKIEVLLSSLASDYDNACKVVENRTKENKEKKEAFEKKASSARNNSDAAPEVPYEPFYPEGTAEEVREATEERRAYLSLQRSNWEADSAVQIAGFKTRFDALDKIESSYTFYGKDGSERTIYCNFEYPLSDDMLGIPGFYQEQKNKYPSFAKNVLELYKTDDTNARQLIMDISNFYAEFIASVNSFNNMCEDCGLGLKFYNDEISELEDLMWDCNTKLESIEDVIRGIPLYLENYEISCEEYLSTVRLQSDSFYSAQQKFVEATNDFNTYSMGMDIVMKNMPDEILSLQDADKFASEMVNFKVNYNGMQIAYEKVRNASLGMNLMYYQSYPGKIEVFKSFNSNIKTPEDLPEYKANIDYYSIKETPKTKYNNLKKQYQRFAVAGAAASAWDNLIFNLENAKPALMRASDEEFETQKNDFVGQAQQLYYATYFGCAVNTEKNAQFNAVISEIVSERSGYVAVDSVTSDSKIKTMSLSESNTNTVKSGESIKLSVSVLPESATDNEIIWSTSDARTASVDGDGNVFGYKCGTAVITARARDSVETVDSNGNITYSPEPVTFNVTVEGTSSAASEFVTLEDYSDNNSKMYINCCKMADDTFSASVKLSDTHDTNKAYLVLTTQSGEMLDIATGNGGELTVEASVQNNDTVRLKLLVWKNFASSPLCTPVINTCLSAAE